MISMDNSSLSLALSEPTSASKLEEAIRRGGRRLYVTRYAIEETLSGGSVPNVKIRGAALLRLMENLGDWFAIPPDIETFCTLELSQLVLSTPQSKSQHEDISGFLCEGIDERTLEAIRRNVLDQKTKSKAFDDEVHREATRMVTQHDGSVADFLNNYGVGSIPGWIPEWGLKRFGVGKGEGARVLANPDRHRCITAWCGLVHWNMFTTIPSEEKRLLGGCPQVARALRFDKGIWYDAIIAASAAYCYTLVSDDEALRDKCNHLHSRGVLRFSAITLEEFLEQAGPCA